MYSPSGEEEVDWKEVGTERRRLRFLELQLRRKESKKLGRIM